MMYNLIKFALNEGLKFAFKVVESNGLPLQVGGEALHDPFSRHIRLSKPSNL